MIDANGLLDCSSRIGILGVGLLLLYDSETTFEGRKDVVDCCVFLKKEMVEWESGSPFLDIRRVFTWVITEMYYLDGILMGGDKLLWSRATEFPITFSTFGAMTPY